MNEKPKCEYCKNAIRRFKVSKDWDTRRYHRTCYKIKTERDLFNERLRRQIAFTPFFNNW